MLPSQTLRQRYKIIKLLGSGGFGDTYLANDLDLPYQPKCVVKHFSPKNSDAKAIEIAKRLFTSEAECLSKLGNHERIPRLYAHFEEGGQFYLVQEYIEGQDLSADFEPGVTWQENKIVSFLKELLEVLAVIHQHNTIHRDIKPANIMRRDRDGKLFLIDFGAVKEILTVDKNGKTEISNRTVGIGTRTYMPPEQSMGQPGKYSDIYAVGKLAIQALTGLNSIDLPSHSQQFEQILEERQIEIAPQLKEVLSKMVSLQPKDRYGDASAALAALGDTEIIPPIPNPPTPKPSPKPSSKLALAAMAAIALLAGGGFYGWKLLDRPAKADYSQLKIYLQDKQWQQADEESDKLLLSIAGKSSALDAESINEFDCDALQTIDELWTSNSNGRFGYTPQKVAYQETGNEIDQYTQAAYEAFGNKIGWRVFDVWSLYGDLKFTDIAPVGHLPSPGKVNSNSEELRTRERGNLLSRFDACGL